MVSNMGENFNNRLLFKKVKSMNSNGITSKCNIVYMMKCLFLFKNNSKDGSNFSTCCIYNMQSVPLLVG